jgi:hypothetical protein
MFCKARTWRSWKRLLAFLEVHDATVHNAKDAAEDRLRKLKIARRWDSPN